MTKKIIFAVVPPIYWIFLGIGLLLKIPNGMNELSNQIIILILTLLLIKVGIIIHEAGHLLFAKLFNGKPKRMILGIGHEVHRFHYFNIKIILNNKFRGGLATATFDNQEYLKFRNFMFTVGGPLTNFMVAFLCYLLFDFDLLFFRNTSALDIASAFIFANIYLGIFSLLPYYVHRQGIKIPTDGLRLFQTLFKKNEDFKIAINENDYFEAIDYFEAKEYDKAITIFKRYAEIEDIAFTSNLNLGIMYLKKGEIDSALVLYLQCISSIEEKENKKYEALINNNLAWIYLLKQDYDKADEHSKISFAIDSKTAYFRGTRGCSLIEVGRVKEGVELLKPNVDFNYPNSQTLCASMYLFYAFSLLGKEKKKKKYFDFVLKNEALLDVDENILWNSIKQRTIEKDNTLQV